VHRPTEDIFLATPLYTQKAHLFDDEHGVVEHLSLQHRMKNSKQCAEMQLTITERNDDCDSLTCDTRLRVPAASETKLSVPQFQLTELWRFERHVHSTDCTPSQTHIRTKNGKA